MSLSNPYNRPRVALLVESSRAYGRGVLQGIAAYVRSHGPWAIYHHERALAAGVPPWLRRWQGDGIIARLEDRSMIRVVRRLGVPVVDVRQRYSLEGIPAVNTDDEATAALAHEHLRERGLQQFAFCGYSAANYSRDRLAAFRARLAVEGQEPFVYEGRRTSGTLDTTAIEESEIEAEAALGDWLDSLPRPIGILAANDIRAQQVLSVCRQRQLLVPEEAAVIGVDNDEVLCELCDPPLSSVQPDVRGIGYQAAAILDALMRGQDESPPSVVRVPPLGVVVRRSTDMLAIADRQTAAALRLIHEQACRGITVNDVVRQLTLSRSTLERKFAASVGRSPKEEIERVRLERIKQMLSETQYPLRVIAERTGFPFPEYLNTFFKHHTGETPAAFRRRMEQEEAAPPSFSWRDRSPNRPPSG